MKTHRLSREYAPGRNVAGEWVQWRCLGRFLKIEFCISLCRIVEKKVCKAPVCADVVDVLGLLKLCRVGNGRRAGRAGRAGGGAGQVVSVPTILVGVEFLNLRVPRRGRSESKIDYMRRALSAEEVGSRFLVWDESRLADLYTEIRISPCPICELVFQLVNFWRTFVRRIWGESDVRDVECHPFQAIYLALDAKGVDAERARRR